MRLPICAWFCIPPHVYSFPNATHLTAGPLTTVIELHSNACGHGDGDRLSEDKCDSGHTRPLLDGTDRSVGGGALF